MKKLADISFFESLGTQSRSDSVVFNNDTTVVYNGVIGEFFHKLFSPAYRKKLAQEAEERRLAEEERSRALAETLSGIKERVPGVDDDLLDYFRVWSADDVRGDKALTDTDYKVLDDFAKKVSFWKDWGKDAVDQAERRLEDGDAGGMLIYYPSEYGEYAFPNPDNPLFKKLSSAFKSVFDFRRSLPANVNENVLDMIQDWLGYTLMDVSYRLAGSDDYVDEELAKMMGIDGEDYDV